MRQCGNCVGFPFFLLLPLPFYTSYSFFFPLLMILLLIIWRRLECRIVFCWNCSHCIVDWIEDWSDAFLFLFYSFYHESWIRLPWANVIYLILLPMKIVSRLYTPYLLLLFTSFLFYYHIYFTLTYAALSLFLSLSSPFSSRSLLCSESSNYLSTCGNLRASLPCFKYSRYRLTSVI